MPGFKATAICQISITEFIQALTGQQKDDHNLLVKIVYALIRTKLSKKQADLEQLTNFGLEIENMGLNRNQLNPTLFCWLLYTYLDSRYEALQKYEKVKEAEQTRLREEQERLREEQEDNDNSDDEMNDSKTKTSKTPEASDYTTF